MVSIQQWRASIGCFASSKSKQSSSNEFSNEEESYVNEDKILKFSRKCVFACVLLTIAFLPIIDGNFHMDTQNGLNHSAVIKSLLVRSGIEQNPGPTTPAEVIGNLIATAPSDEVKKTLNKFDTEKDHKDNVKNFSKPTITVDDLKKTLVFIENRIDDTGLGDFLKEGLVEMIVLRIEQILPDTCNTCGKGFAISIFDEPKIKCIICSKGCCQPCTEKYSDQLKNVGLNDIFWFCSSCNQKRHEEQSERHAKLLKSTAKKAKESNNAKESLGTNETEANNEETVIVIDDDNKKEDNSKNKENSKKEEESSKKKENAEKEEENSKKKGNKSEQKDIPCRFFRQNRCRFGASGKGCNFKHQKICQRFIKHGKDNRLGCAGVCDKFHPPMCKTSVNTKKCFMENCRLIHLKGTKRVPDKRTNTKDEAKETSKKDPKADSKNAARSKESNSFLELRKEVENLKQLLQNGAWNGYGHGAQTVQRTLPLMHQMTMPMTQGLPQMMATNPMMFHPIQQHMMMSQQNM